MKKLIAIILTFVLILSIAPCISSASLFGFGTKSVRELLCNERWTSFERHDYSWPVKGFYYIVEMYNFDNNGEFDFTYVDMEPLSKESESHHGHYTIDEESLTVTLVYDDEKNVIDIDGDGKTSLEMTEETFYYSKEGKLLRVYKALGLETGDINDFELVEYENLTADGVVKRLEELMK